MRTSLIKVVIILLVSFLLSSCAAQPKVSVILTAFGDKDATFGETQPFLKALEGKVDRTKDATYCKGLYEGKLAGQAVVIATTGTGSGNAGPCMQEILYQYNTRIKEVIWSGIGGISPAVGGIVDNQTGKLKTQMDANMIGDVCISPLAWNYDLHFSSIADWKASIDAGAPLSSTSGWWNMKNSKGKADVIGFENVQQFAIADKTLADELLAAAKQVDLPEASPDVITIEKRFFPEDKLRKEKFFDYSQCGEISSDNFWHGVVEDRLSRQYLADLINAAGYVPKKVTEDDVVSFSAMESVPWMSIVTRWSQKNGIKIPMVVVRAGSNYAHPTLDANGQVVAGKDGKPMSGMDDILLGFQDAGAAFAWQNAALPVLKMFELRRP